MFTRRVRQLAHDGDDPLVSVDLHMGFRGRPRRRFPEIEGALSGTETKVSIDACFAAAHPPPQEGSSRTGMQTIDTEDRGRIDETQLVRDDDYRLLADCIPALIAFMSPNGDLESVNRHVLEYFGATLEQLKSWSIADAVHRDDLPIVIAAWTLAVGRGEPYDIEHRMRRADGMYRWFHVRGQPISDNAGRITRWCVLQTDIDDRRRAEALLAAEKRFLEMVASGRSLSTILEALCLLVESTASGCYCSVVLVDSSGERLDRGAAPSLPASFITSIIGRPVNVESGPCAMASYLNERVVAPDLTSESRWAEHAWCAMALSHGLKACWSTPFSSTAGKVLGAFAIYYDEPTLPTVQQQSLIDQFTHIASIAVERAQSDTALRRSEESFRAIVATTPECVKVIARDGSLLRVNSAGVTMSGATSEDAVIGANFYDFVAPEHLALYREFNETVCSGHNGFLEFDIISMRGERRHVETHAAPMRHDDGSIVQLGITRDISERKQSQERLRQSEAFLAEGQRLSQTGSFSWRLDSDEIAFSDELYRIFELEPSTSVSLERIGMRVHPEDRSLLSEKINRARADGCGLHYDIRLQMPDGRIKYLQTNAHRIQHRDDRLEYLGAIQDVTERRLSEEALARVRSELARVARVTSLGALTASIAHEVNQPLSGILTNASTCLRMLSAEPPNVEGARETARRTIRDGKRAADVITRLRALFIGTNPTVEAVDLNDAVHEVIAILGADLQRGGVALLSELGAHIPRVTGDRVQLQQVILNLLRNAVEATNGVDDRPRRVVLRTEQDGDRQVRLTVRDNGAGFEAEGASRLFEAFYTTKRDGMGIGLSVSRSIVERHNGRLWAAPNGDGPGVTFAFTVPGSFPAA